MLELLSEEELFKLLTDIKSKKDLPKSQIQADTKLIMQELYKRNGLSKYFDLLYDENSIYNK